MNTIMSEVKHVKIVPIRELLANSILYESTTRYDPATHTMHIYQTQGELDDGNLLDYSSIKKGLLRHCPTCFSWVSEKNTGTCPETLQAVCSCCGFPVNGKWYSRKGKWKKTIKDFVGGGDGI